MIFRLGTVAIFFFSAVTITGTNIYRDPATTDTHPLYSCLVTLSKPGQGCDLHPDYPQTIQCAESKMCINMSQFNNGKCDCCGPDVDCATCYDHSDENRIKPPGDPKYCASHPHFKLGLTFQCATRPEICLSQLTEWNNARCDCCPEVNGDCCHVNCTDHSDEECMPDQWANKFTCDGTCKSLEKFSDTVSDCSYHCVENNTDARKSCEASRREHDRLVVEAQCDELRRTNTSFYKCPSGAQKCITTDCIHDGVSDCEHAEDEDWSRHPLCDTNMKNLKCKPNTYECYLVDQGQNTFCRCTKNQKTSCNK